MQLLPVVAVLVLLASPLAGQDPTPRAEPDTALVEPSPEVARRGSQVLIPLGSIVLPGLGQYMHGARRAGLAHTATAVVGIAAIPLGDPTLEDLPRRPGDQLSDQGFHLVQTAGFLSAWDAFHRSVPALQQQGKYEFLGPREHLRDLITAPFDHRFLRRWTTWVDLAQTAAITALVLSDRRTETRYHRFRVHDAAWAASLSMNAAVGEEALFRGWLLPLAYEHTGQRFWVANGLQAGVFSVGHLPDAGWFAVYHFAWAAWEGWVVRRNEWSIRESVFHHFWYNAAIVTASMLTQEREAEVRITFPAITF